MPRFWPAEADLTEALRLGDEANGRHAAIVASFKADEIDQVVLAKALEAETLPLWSAALAKAEKLKTNGVDGEALDDVIGYLRLCRNASEQLVESIRAEDEKLYDRAIETWQKAADGGRRSRRRAGWCKVGSDLLASFGDRGGASNAAIS